MASIDRAERFGRAKRIGILVALQATIMLVMLLCGDIKYEVSDDFVMQLLVSGASSLGESDNHMMFSSRLWGGMLQLLYQCISTVNWYLWCQIAVGFLSCCGVACIMGKRMPLFYGAVCTGVFALFLKDLYILPQFTKTAAAAFAAGGALFLEELADRRGRSKLRIALALTLVLLGCLVRHNSLYIALASIVLLARYLARQNRREERPGERTNYALVCLLLLVAVFGLRCLDRLSYFVEDDYRYFLRYSYTRALIVDYPRPTYEECREELEEIGLSPVDYELIPEWCFADKQVFSLEKMQQVLSIVNRHRPKPYPTVWSVIRHMVGRGVYKYPGTIACVLFSGAILAEYVARARRGDKAAGSFWSSCWIPFVAAAVVLAEMGLLTYGGRIVYRVEYGLLFSTAVLLLFPLSDVCGKGIPETKALRCCLGGLSLLLLVAIAWRLAPDTACRTMSDEEYRNHTTALFEGSGNYDARKYRYRISARPMSGAFLQEVETHKANLYLLDFHTTIQSLYPNFSPVLPVPEGTFDNMVYLGGVTVNHPWVDSQLRRYGLSDPLRGLLEDHVYLVCNENAGLVLEWLRIHCDPDATMTLYKEVDGYKIWSFRSGD